MVKFSHPTSDGESEDEEEVGAGVLEATANVTKQMTSKQSASRNGAVVRRQLTPDSPGWLTVSFITFFVVDFSVVSRSCLTC